MPITAAPTARESIEAAFDEVVKDDAAIPAQETQPAEPTAPAATEAKVEAPAQESEAEKAERLRNKDGTFAKGQPAPKTAAVAIEAPKPKTPRPTSWRKDLEPQWETLSPELQAYVQQREKEYQTGVSTYKTEADRAKGVMQAIAPFEPLLQQAQIPVDRWIGELGHAHRILSTGTSQDKMGMIQTILANNRIPAQLAVQDAQGNWQLLAQQPQAQQQQPQQQQITPQSIKEHVAQALLARDVDQMYAAFSKAVEEGKHPHYEEVKETMAGLLQSGLAEDYASAYEASLVMPKHRHLVAAVQPQAPQPAASVVDKSKEAARARSQAVSVKSSTPSAMTQATGPKSLRDQLSESFDSVTARRV